MQGASYNAWVGCRHDGYGRDGAYHRFEDFVAYALVPPWIQETLFEGRDEAKPLFEDGEVVERERLNTAVATAYPRPATFDAYAQLWGKYQSVRIIQALSNPTIRDQYANTRVRLGQRYEETFDIRLRPAYGDYKRMRKCQRNLLEEAIAFRGGSYFNCCVIDEAEEGAERFKIVDLLQMVANAELEWFDEEDFYVAAEQAGRQRHIFERHKPLTFFRLHGWRDEWRDYRLRLNHDIGDWGMDKFGKAMLLKGWQLDTQVPGLTALNNRLSRRHLPALLCLGYHPVELKRLLRLPMLFPVYQFESMDGIEGCVAFGREGLLLEARLQYSRLDCGGSAMIL